MSWTCSDAFKDHPDFTSLQELPDSYTWTPQQDDEYPTGDSIFESVPVIDLNNPNAAQLIGEACKTWGVFQVINHGIPTYLLDGIESTSRTLFSLPHEQKLKVYRLPDGASGYGTATISSFFSKLMWYEGFTIFGSPLDHFCKLWPQDYNKHCEIVEEFSKEMRKLAGKLMWLMLHSLGITKEDISWAGPKGDFPNAASVLQLNYYPACPDPDRAMGLAPHTDSALLTILYQGNISGLQVLKEGTGWVTVTPISNGLVVNTGDLLHMLSNGLYQSVVHRAIVNRTKSRVSMACFYGPESNAFISPLPKLIGPSNPLLYRPITWSEYRSLKSKLYLKTLSTLKVNSPENEPGQVNDT